MPPEPVVLEGVRESYGARRALDGVSFAIRSGAAVGNLGPNGAGKTTTFRLLTGVTRRDAGTVRVMGEDRRRAPRRGGTSACSRTAPAFSPT